MVYETKLFRAQRTCIIMKVYYILKTWKFTKGSELIPWKHRNKIAMISNEWLKTDEIIVVAAQNRV